MNENANSKMSTVMATKMDRATYVRNFIKAAAKTVAYGWDGVIAGSNVAAQQDFLGKVVEVFNVTAPKGHSIDMMAYSDDGGAYISASVIGTDHHFTFKADEVIPDNIRLFKTVDEEYSLTDREVDAIQKAVNGLAAEYLTPGTPGVAVQAGFTSRCQLMLVIEPCSGDYAERRKIMMKTVNKAIANAADPNSHWDPNETDNPYKEFPNIAYAGMDSVLKSKADNALFLDLCEKVGNDLADAYPDGSDDRGVVWIENHYDCIYGGLTGRAYDDEGGYTYPAHKPENKKG